jgi:hypothetical protein
MMTRARTIWMVPPMLAAVIAMAVVLAACGGTTDEAARQRDAGLPPGYDEGASEADDIAFGDLDSEGSASRAGVSIPSVTDRKIITTATLELAVEDVITAVQEVENIVETAGGFISSSSVFVDSEEGNGSDRRTATVTVRVPADGYGSVMSQLRSIADEVESETVDTSEVTEEYADLQARRRNLEATELSYLALLERADTIPDILTVQDRLDEVRLEIERVEGRMNVLNDLTDLATITVRLRPSALVVEDDERGWAEAAWEESWEASKGAAVVLGTIVIAGGVLMVWLVVVLLVGTLVWRQVGRKLADWVIRIYRA